MARQSNPARLTRAEVAIIATTALFLATALPLACRKARTQSPHFDSHDLKKTSVLPTLDCPLPTSHNAIWCATFQMAWDKFRNDVVGEPIVVTDAEELTGRLNGATFPTADIEEHSYYATVGKVDDGILKAIQKEMARRFPTATPPTFDDRYRTLPDVTVAFAYLAVDLDFKHPFYTNECSFIFAGSDDTHTNVTSFSSFDRPGRKADRIREQVEILHYERGDTRDSDTFVVDLCRHTQPYQVILARVPLQGTFRETLATVKAAISRFQSDPDHETLRTLRRIDELTVPDVLYKLTHHFAGLENKSLGNPQWQATSVLEAVQMIDFSLSRTGVVLRSSGTFSTAFSRTVNDEPRLFYFNRPFLIYVKKRQPHAQPFFVMWVDNAELLQPYIRSP